MFSSIQFEVPGRRVLDLFAAADSLALRRCQEEPATPTFVRQHQQAVTIITGNVKRCELENKASVFCREWQSPFGGHCGALRPRFA
jgi:16S rRNA G966 N2-methylase RsmD